MNPRTDISEENARKRIDSLLLENPWLKELKISDKLTNNQRLQILELALKYKKAFSLSEYDLGLTHLMEFEIPTTNTEPINRAPYKLPYEKKQALKKIIPDMIKAGIIEESDSPYNNPIVMVKKPNSEFRMCLDMRKLNQVTKEIQLPIPSVQESLDVLKNQNFYSSLDLFSAYHQLAIKKEGREKTAFTANSRKFHYKTMVFGCKGAPFVFAHLMEKVLGSMNFQKLLVYLDDILVFSRDFQVHIQRLEATFKRLIDANLKLKISKCAFAHSMVKFLGYIVGRNGVTPNPNKLVAITNHPFPKNIKEIQRFSGMLNPFMSAHRNN